MLASAPVRAAGERVGELGPARARPRSRFCAIFFGGGPRTRRSCGSAASLCARRALCSCARRSSTGRPRSSSARSSASRSGRASRASGRPRPTASGLHEPHARLCGVRAPRRARRRARPGAAARARGRGARSRLVAGWALLAKCVPALYSDYGRARAAARAARLLERARAPLRRGRRRCAVARGARAASRRRRPALRARRHAPSHVLALRRRARLRRRSGLDRPRPATASRASSRSCSAAAPAPRSFGIALALPGITSDGAVALGARARRLDLRARRPGRRARSSRRVRFALARREVAPARRARIERVAGVAAVVARGRGRRAEHRRSRGASGHEFTNPGNTQVVEHDDPPREREERPLGVVAGGVARVHATSGRRHRRRHVPADEPDAPARRPSSSTSRTTCRCSS